MAKPLVWTIAGSDSGGGAGIQADLHTFADFNVHGCTVLTALTAQNSIAVDDIQYTTKQNLFKQLYALENDLSANVIKIGMIGNKDNIDVIHAFLIKHNKTVIYDPVMVSTSGVSLMEETQIEYVVKNIFPLVYLLTPNIHEVNTLLETEIKTLKDIEDAAKLLLTFGPKQILIKGGHGDNDFCYDYYTDGKESFWLSSARIRHPCNESKDKDLVKKAKLRSKTSIFSQIEALNEASSGVYMPVNEQRSEFSNEELAKKTKLRSKTSIFSQIEALNEASSGVYMPVNEQRSEFSNEELAKKTKFCEHTHGAGCTLSAAITALLALRYNIKDALVIAKMYVTQGIRLAQLIGQGPGAVAHTGWPLQQQDVPCLTKTQPVKKSNKVFPDCGESLLGIYPIVNSFAWIERLVNAGVTTIQLRIKDKDPAWIEQQIQLSVELCQQRRVRLFINDYWQLALQYQAYGVHLGQEDLDHINIETLYQSGLRLGISTHCYYEVARAHALKPSYIAIGPIFHTDSKAMVFAPQGIAQLKQWRVTLSDYHLVAIGGINNTNLTQVIATNVDGIAVISAITKSEDPEATVKEWQRQMQSVPFNLGLNEK